MKKILTLLLIVSVVAGMTLPAMASEESHGVSAGSSSNGGTNGQDFDTGVTGSNIASTTVNVVLTVEPQTNNVGEVLGASGDNINGAVADQDAIAKADDATTGQANSGGAGSGATSGEAENNHVNAEDSEDGVPVSADSVAVSVAKTGEAETGDALSIAKASDNDNTAKANDNTLTSGDVNNNVIQVNKVVQIAPVEVKNNQLLVQKVKVGGFQDASSNPIVVAKQKKTDFDLDLDFDIEED